MPYCTHKQTKAWGVVITNGQFVAQGPSVFPDFSQVCAALHPVPTLLCTLPELCCRLSRLRGLTALSSL